MLKAKMGGVSPLNASIRLGGDAPLNASLRLGGDVQSKWLGEWQVGRSYVPLDKVSRGGSSFVCVRPCTAVDPLVDVGDGIDGQYWILIAKKGEDGIDGAAFTYDMFTEEQLEGLRGPEGKDGKDGQEGVKGDSCNIQAEETDDGVELTITNTAYTSSGASNNVQKVVVKNGEDAAPEVFIATYGTTPHAEIKAAFDAGKACFCKSGTIILPLVMCSSASIAFGSVQASIVRAFTVNGANNWSTQTQPVMLRTGGTLTGPLTLSGDPTEDLHAATKAYVDAHAGGGGEPEIFIAIYGTTTHGEIKAAFDAGKACFCMSGGATFGVLMLCTATIARFAYTALGTNIVMDVNASDAWSKTTTSLLSEAGGTMNGPLVLDADPTEALHAATKQYVDDKIIDFTTDATLNLDPETGVLSVNTAPKAERDNTLPITSGAVYSEIGNINVLLSTI